MSRIVKFVFFYFKVVRFDLFHFRSYLQYENESQNVLLITQEQFGQFFSIKYGFNDNFNE